MHWMGSDASQVVSWEAGMARRVEMISITRLAGWCWCWCWRLPFSPGRTADQRLYSSPCDLSMWLSEVSPYHGGLVVVKVFIWQLATKTTRRGNAHALLSLRPDTGTVSCFVFMSVTILIKASNRASPDF